MAKPSPSSAIMFEAGTRTSSNSQLDVALLVHVPEHGQGAHHREARRVHRHQDLALLAVRRGVGVGLAHHDEDLAVRVHRPGDPPLAPVEHVVVAVALDAQGDVGGVARRPRRARSWRTPSGSRPRAAGAATCPAARACRTSSAPPCCRCRAPSSCTPRDAIAAAAHDLGQRRVLEVGQARAPLLVRLEQVPQPTLARPRPSAPPSPPAGGAGCRWRAICCLVHGLVRVDALVHEVEQLLSVLVAAVGEGEVHDANVECSHEPERTRRHRAGRNRRRAPSPRRLLERPTNRAGLPPSLRLSVLP